MDLNAISLESILKEADTYINKMPWWAKFIYSSEVKGFKGVINKEEVLNQNKEETAEWYLKQGTLINETYVNLHSAVNKTYDIYEALKPIYNFVEKLPLIGGFAKRKKEEVKTSLKKRYGIQSIPSRESANHLIKSGYDLVMIGHCVYAGSKTGLGEEFFKQRLYKPNIVNEKPKEEDYVTNFFNSVSNFFEGFFTPSTYKT
jgi:hypothetical protein